MTKQGILTDATAAMLGEMIRNDNVRYDYTKSGGGAQENSAGDRWKLEREILRQLHQAEERVLEMVYYILIG